MAKAFIALKLEEKQNFNVLHKFAQIIHEGMVKKAAVYDAPLPTMVDFQAHVTTLEKAIGKWGQVGNRGSHADNRAVIAAAEVVKDDLRRLKKYVESKTPYDGVSFTEAGFQLRASGGPIGALPGPDKLRVFHGRPFLQGRIQYLFKKVRGAKAYKVWTGTGHLPDLPPHPSLPYQTITANEFIDTDAPPGTMRWIIVGCVGASGTTGYSTLEGTMMP